MEPISSALATVAIIFTIIVAGYNIMKSRKDRKLAQRADLEKEFRAPAERDAIIIGGAEQTVKMLRDALTYARSDMEAIRKERDDHRSRLNMLEKTVAERDELIRDYLSRLRFLEREVARLSKEAPSHEGS